MPLEKVINTAFPALDLKEEIYAQGALELILSFLNLDNSVLDNPMQVQRYSESLTKLAQGQAGKE